MKTIYYVTYIYEKDSKTIIQRARVPRDRKIKTLLEIEDLEKTFALYHSVDNIKILSFIKI